MSSLARSALVGAVLLYGTTRVEAFQTPEIQKQRELELQVKKLTAQVEDLQARLQAMQEAEVKARQQADAARKEAEVARQEALQQREVAEKERARAEAALKELQQEALKQREIAAKLQQEAEAHRQRAEAERARAETLAKDAQQQRDVARKLQEEAQAQQDKARDAEARARIEADLQAARARQLEARVRELEAQPGKGSKADDEATKKHMRAVAGSFLDGLVANDSRSTAAVLTKELRASLGKEGTPEFNKAAADWIDQLSGNGRFVKAVIDTESFAPGGDEAVFGGQIGGGGGGAVFSIRVVKDRESGRYLVAYIVTRRQ